MPDIDALVLATVNASLRRSIDAGVLGQCLIDRAHALAWPAHVWAFFEDVPREAMLRFMLAHRLPAVRVLATYRALAGTEPLDVDLATWLGELADAA